jgi:hypothetical protein
MGPETYFSVGLAVAVAKPIRIPTVLTVTVVAYQEKTIFVEKWTKKVASSRNEPLFDGAEV